MNPQQHPQQKDNRGALYPSARKLSESSPDYWGTATIGGNRMRISGWKRTNDKGMYLSLSFRPDDGYQPNQPKQSEMKIDADGAQHSQADDVPF